MTAYDKEDITLDFLFLSFVVVPPGLSGGIGVGTGHVANSHKPAPPHKFNYRFPAHGHFRNYESHFSTVKKHTKHSPRFIFDPRLVFYGGRQPEKTEKLEVTLKIIAPRGGSCGNRLV